MAMTNKYIIPIFYGPDKLAEICTKSERCPLGWHDVMAGCPFQKDCEDITPEDWEKLEVKDE